MRKTFLIESVMAIKWITLNYAWKAFLLGIFIMLLLWLIASLYVRTHRDALFWSLGDKTSHRKAILVYNPDPFYNFDDQLCKSFATTLSENNWYAEVLTIKAVKEKDIDSTDIMVFCSNAYN